MSSSLPTLIYSTSFFLLPLFFLFTITLLQLPEGKKKVNGNECAREGNLGSMT